jgi:hypothetical protein
MVTPPDNNEIFLFNQAKIMLAISKIIAKMGEG